ncbi:hypothetical protein TNCV_2857531 [Trichonephila clavipes]|nr:hypothetical protein TNCV_2857531 [Trichonephila clavipes]
MTPCGRPAIVFFASAQLILSCISGRLQLPSQRVQTCSIGERSGDLAGHGRTSYLEDIVGRVAQYVDEHYPVDKWHLGDLIAWVAQSALKYRPRICELSKCLEGPLKMIVCPRNCSPHCHTL